MVVFGELLLSRVLRMQETLNELKFAVFFYGIMLCPDNWRRQDINALCASRGCYGAELKDVSRLRADLPLLIVRCGKDEIPFVNDSIDHFIGLAKTIGVPLLKIDFEDGVHAFDVEQRADPRSAEIIRQTLEFMKKHLAPPASK